MKASLAIGIPSSGRYVPLEWALSLASMVKPMNTNYCYLPIVNRPVDEARNLMVEQAKEQGAKYLLMLDDDTAPPFHTINMLMQAIESSDDDVMVAAGIYCSKTLPPTPVVFKEEGEGPFWKWRANSGPFECWGIGTGCMLIKMEVFNHLEKPYFLEIKDVEQAKNEKLIPIDEKNVPSCNVTDDLYFCKKVQKAGFKILADPRVLPIHWDQEHKYYVLPEGSYPVKDMTMTKVAI